MGGRITPPLFIEWVKDNTGNTGNPAPCCLPCVSAPRPQPLGAQGPAGPAAAWLLSLQLTHLRLFSRSHPLQGRPRPLALILLSSIPSTLSQWIQSTLISYIQKYIALESWKRFNTYNTYLQAVTFTPVKTNSHLCLSLIFGATYT